MSNPEIRFCDVCDKAISMKNWAKHTRTIKHKTNTGEIKKDIVVKIHNCDKCEFKTQYKQSLNKHKKTAHSAQKIYYYYCTVCNEPLRDKPKAIIHRQNDEHKLKILYDDKYKDYVKINKIYDDDGQNGIEVMRFLKRKESNKLIIKKITKE